MIRASVLWSEPKRISLDCVEHITGIRIFVADF
jgi:hypothetical protein